MNEDFSDILLRISHSKPQKIVFSNPRNKSENIYVRIVVSSLELSGEASFQIARYTDKQVFHENIPADELESALISKDFIKAYKQINVFGDLSELEIKLNKDYKAHISEKRLEAITDGNTPRISPNKGNNRKKNYILEEETDIPVFRELGIFTSDNRIVSSKYDKFKQINRFTEFVEDALKDFHKDEINIIDFGCGKSYLTFVIYHYLVEIKKIKANIVGLDLKTDVINKCNTLAKKYDYKGLGFEVGDINGYKAPFDVDMVVTLHACDTATDYALYNAVSWNAGMILSVPCCQHEVNKAIKSDRLSALTKYGIVKERTSALITDAIRGSMLEYRGYKTELLEFVDIEHSPKNILIRAVKRNISVEKRNRSLEEAKSICREFNIEPTIMKLLSR